jgi:hypothetical protein
LLIDDELVTLSPISAPCDAASGNVNPGDSFSLGFEYCWMDLTVVGEDFGALYDGLIGMNSWTGVVTNNVLTANRLRGDQPQRRRRRAGVRGLRDLGDLGRHGQHHGAPRRCREWPHGDRILRAIAHGVKAP